MRRGKNKNGVKDAVANGIVEYVLETQAHCGDKLLSEMDFAAYFGVGHLTVRSALAKLARDGIVERCPKSGTYLKKLPDNLRHLCSDYNNDVVLLLTDKGHFYSDLTGKLISSLSKSGFSPSLVPIPEREFSPASTKVTIGKIKNLVA